VGDQPRPPGSAVVEAIRRRRSVRWGFAPEPLPPGVVEEIVACGLAAPSSKNSQPWRLHVVTDRSVLRAVAAAVASHCRRGEYVPHDPATGQPYRRYASTVGDSAGVLAEVPLAVFVENLGPFSRGVEGLLAADRAALGAVLFGFALEMVACGAAIENMWLAAEGLGLRAVLLGDVAIVEPELREWLGLRGDLIGALAVGRSAAALRPPMDSPALPEVERAVWYGTAASGGAVP
jgi:nitroreductase